MILSNDFRRQWEDVRADVLKATQEFGESGWYILGERVQGFELNLAVYWGREFAVGVASGLDALEISLRILGCGPGSRVLTSAISAFATALAIVKTGAVPVFIDCDRYGLIDLDACRDLLKRRPDVRYFVPVHLYGHALDGAALRSLRDEFGLAIVEDCAQSIGACSAGVPTGAAGQLAATSFYPTKNLGALGDGGAILTDSPELAACARMLRDYGQSRKYHHEVIGYNSRLDELQATYLDRVFLPRLNGWIERRKRIAQRYCHEIHNRRICIRGAPAASESSWHLFPVIVADGKTDLFREHLQRHGIQTGQHYPLALMDQPALHQANVETASDCRNAREFCRSELSFPIHPYLANEEVSAIIDAANSWHA